MEKGEISVLYTQPGETAEGKCDPSWALSKSTLGIGIKKEGHALRKKMYEIRCLELEIIIAS